jgi:hypothetical protein
VAVDECAEVVAIVAILVNVLVVDVDPVPVIVATTATIAAENSDVCRLCPRWRLR